MRTTPEKIDAMMESKHVLGASKLLISSIRQAMSKDMMQIGALDDIRRTLTTQKNVKFERHCDTDQTMLTAACRHFTTYSLKSFIIIYTSKTHTAIIDGLSIRPDNKTVCQFGGDRRVMITYLFFQTSA